MRNVSDESFRKKLRHILCSVAFVFDYRAVFEITLKNFVEPGRQQMTTWRMRNECWIPRLQIHTRNM